MTSVGRLIYQERHVLDVEDRLLSHLRIVIMNKLRRQEPFMLMAPHLDGQLIEQMMQDASGPNGLVLDSTM